MAIYQFQLTVLPQKGVLEKFGLVPQKLEIDCEERENSYPSKKEDLVDVDDKLYDDIAHDWWSSIELSPFEIIHQLDKILKRASYGDDNWYVWKTYSKDIDNDAAMLINSVTGKIEELQFRVDLREKNLMFLQKMLVISTKYNWLLMDVKRNLSKPELKQVLSLVQDSNSYKFILNPFKFLTELDEEKIE